MKKAWMLVMVLTGLCLPVFSFGDAPTGVAAPAAVAMAEPSLVDVAMSFYKWATSVKSMPWQAAIAAFLFLLVGTMRNSMLSKWTWDKLGSYKFLAAPVLSLIAMLLTTSPFSWAGVFTALTTGLGAMLLHEIMDKLKTVPAVGPKYSGLLDLIGKLLKKPAEPPKAA